MNQILCTKIKNKHKTFFKIQFTVSIIILIILISFIFYYILYLQKQEKLSNGLIGNYSIYQLYSNYSEPNIGNKISSENKISFSRQYYNQSVENLNVLLQTLPSNIIASIFNINSNGIELYEVENEEVRKNVKVDFGNK